MICLEERFRQSRSSTVVDDLDYRNNIGNRNNKDNRDDTYSDNMEQETLFTASKWGILTELEKQEHSPMELAKILKTSVANVSQQLRLLEMAGLVQSKRISNREKGLPRVLYSLAGNHSYLIAAAKEFVDKRFLQLTERNKVSLRIWFWDNLASHYFLEKAFWSIEEHLPKIEAIFIDRATEDVAIVSNDSKLKSKIKNLKCTNPDGLIKEMKFKFLKSSQIDSKNFYKLYDPTGMQK